MRFAPFVLLLLSACSGGGSNNSVEDREILQAADGLEREADLQVNQMVATIDAQLGEDLNAVASAGNGVAGE